MIWKKCLLQRAADTTNDELGNEVVGAWKTVKKTVCRFTPWMDEQIALEGREVTKHEQQYLVPIPYCKFPECERAVLDGRIMDIVSTTDLSPRLTLLRVKSYKE